MNNNETLEFLAMVDAQAADSEVEDNTSTASAKKKCTPASAKKKCTPDADNDEEEASADRTKVSSSFECKWPTCGNRNMCLGGQYRFKFDAKDSLADLKDKLLPKMCPAMSCWAKACWLAVRYDSQSKGNASKRKGGSKGKDTFRASNETDSPNSRIAAKTLWNTGRKKLLETLKDDYGAGEATAADLEDFEVFMSNF